MYFINCTSTLLKRAQMLRKFSKKVQIKPSQLLTSRIQIQTRPFTNCSCTISTADFLSLLNSNQKFEIDDNSVIYDFSYSVSNTKLEINRRHALYSDDFPVFLVEDSEASFQIPKYVIPKIRQITCDVLSIHIQGKTLRIEANSDVLLTITSTGVEHLSGRTETEFKIRNADIGFLQFCEDENVVISTFDTCVIFCMLDAESTTIVRAPLLQ